MKFAVSKHPFSLKPMTAYVLSTLVLLTLGNSAFNNAFAQTTSEDLWGIPQENAQTVKQLPEPLPYCEDLQKSSENKNVK